MRNIIQRYRTSAGILLVLVCLLAPSPAMSSAIERQNNVVDQYFYIVDHFLRSAYKTQGPQQSALFQQSIAAFGQLLQWFGDEQDAPTLALSQYQVAKSYQMLGDVQKAREAYQVCIEYQRFAKLPVKEKGSADIVAVIDECKKELKSL